MALIVAAALVVLTTPVAARVAVRIGVIDRPGPLKVQTRPVPYLGGVAVFAGLAGPVAWAEPALLVPLGLALVLGLADDVADVPARLRLAGEVVIGATAAVALPGTISPAGAAATVIATVALLNAVNLLDGLDGLATSVAALGALGFSVVLDGDARSTAMALAGALLGFLVWNRPPARIYLGDAGSYLVGTALALLLALTATTDEGAATTAGALLFVAVPVADTTIAIVRRLRAGRPLFQGDRGHVYDQLVDLGWSSQGSALACAGAQGAFVALGLVASTLAAGPGVTLVAVVIASVGAAALWAFTAPSPRTTRTT
ncbi:MAG TPA: MraY family glycosyltransferase [Acidimicrobiales bacterium]|jgi:UDP-GlcNAc:undecaprenyl-phosphate GlcNAc-1-phosphate transferase|nr:MraY family glycosyltransferase [Acidimicrobiales bacterium]